MSIDVYSRISERKKKATATSGLDTFSKISEKKKKDSNTGFTSNTSQGAVSKENSLSLAWKAKIADADNQIKQLKSTDINTLPVAGREAAVKDIQTKISDLTTAKQEYEKEYNYAIKNGEQILEWYSVPNNADYAERSKYVTTKENLTDDQLIAQGWRKTEAGDEWVKGVLNPQYYDGGGDSLYEYINDPDVRSIKKANEMAYGNYDMGYDMLGYDKLTDKELGIYNYLYSSDKEEANKFLEMISPELQTRSLEKVRERAEESAKEDPVGASVMSVATNLKNAAVLPAKVAAAATGTYDEHRVLDLYDTQTKAVRSKVGEMAADAVDVNIPLVDVNLGEFSYNTAMSLADMGAAIVLGGGQSIPVSVIMASSSGSSTMADAKNNGASDGKALALGLGAAAIEAATEKFSIDALFGDSKTALGHFFKNAVTEASEETASSVLNTGLDELASAIEGSESDIRKNINSLMEAEGLSEKDATKQAMMSWFKDVGADALGGFVSGSTVAIPGTAATSLKTNETRQQIKNVQKMNVDVADRSLVQKGVSKIMNAAAKGIVFDNDDAKQKLVDSMSEKGYIPSAASSDAIKHNLKGVSAYGGADAQTIQRANSIAEKLDVMFSDAWYNGGDIASGRKAADLYSDGAIVGNTASAVVLARQAADSQTDSTAKTLIQKAFSLMPISYTLDTELTGDVATDSDIIIKTAEKIFTQTEAKINHTGTDYFVDIAKTINEATALSGAVNVTGEMNNLIDMLLDGVVDERLEYALGDESATDMLSQIMGTYIDNNETVDTIKRKLKDMVSAYKAGSGSKYNNAAKIKFARMKIAENEIRLLDKEQVDADAAMDVFKNVVYNGKLTKAQAKLIAYDEDLLKILSRITGVQLDDKSKIGDIMAAASIVSGYDLTAETAVYDDVGISGVSENSVDLPSGEVGIYDPDTGRIILNANATSEQKMGYELARRLLNDAQGVTVDPEFKLDGNGKLHFDGDTSALTELQRGSIKALERLSDALGIDVYIEAELGTYKNGWFDHSDNSIHISLDAGVDGRGTLLFTAAHELTHFIKKYSPEKWQSMAEFIIVKGLGPDADVGKLIRDKQNLYKENGDELTNGEAEQEIVADACEQMLVDGSAFEVLAELRKTDASLFDRIKYFITNLVAKIRNLYKDIAPGSAEAKYISEMNGAAAELQQLFNDALVDADINFASGKSQSSDDGIQYSISKNAEKDIQNVLADKFYEKEVKLTDSTPSIMLGHKGVRNLPLMMVASHIRENILTEAEAKNLGLPINDKNFHGLGETLFLDVIRDLDNVTEAYRGTKRADNADRRENYFLLISKHKDANGDEINVPVYINEYGIYNKVEIDVNKIATVFGKERLRNYLSNEIRRGNIVKIKNRSAQQSSEQTAPIAGRYRKEPSIVRDAQASSKAETIAAEHDMHNSNNNISNSDENVNADSKNNQNSIRNASVSSISSGISGSLTNNILTYMRSHGYNMDSEYVRVAKKFDPYFIEHRSRLNSSLLSEDNLNREIVADFLTNVFTDSATMEKLADNNLDLAVDIAERVKAYADTATDKQMKDFASDVCKQLISVIRSDERADELQAVLHNRTQSGVDSSALYDSIDSGRIDFSERDEDSVIVKVKDWYNNLKRGFVDSGEAIARLGKLLDNETIYHRYNNTKQSQDAIAYMLEKAQTDIEGNKIGKSLKDVFKPIIADKGKYEKFCLYMQYINNAERAVNDKAIFSDMTKEHSLERAESLLRSNPEFKAWSDDVYKYNDGLMSWLIDSGLLTRDQYNEMKKQNPHYVPAFVVDTTKHDKPSFTESVVVKKTVKRAKGGAEKVMPLLDAMQMKTSQIVKEARMNMLALEIVDTMKRKDLLEDGPKGFTVKDPALEEFVYQITAVRDSKYYEPTKVNGKYVTVNTNRKLKDDIKDLFSFADGKKNDARNIVSEYVRKLTYSETFVASDAELLAQELINRAISPGANADALYYQYPELRTDLANAKLYVPPETVNEIPDYSDFKNSLFGRVTLTTREGDGMHVDTAYTIWSGAYPELFDTDIINTTDQIYKIKEVVEKLKKPPEVTLRQMYGENIGAVKAELTDDIKRLSIQAIKDAHSERAEIEKDVEAHAFATYDVGSTNNLEFSKGEQDGNRMVFYADGIRHTMDIGKSVFEGLKNISFDPDAKNALKPVQKLNDTFKKLVTSYNPFFSVRNFIRDLQDAVMYSSDTKRMLRNLPRAYKEIATNGEMWQLYQSLGGVGSSYFDFKKQIDLETDMSTKSKATRAYKRVSGVVEQINVAVEQAPRLAEFITVLEKSDGSYAAKLKALYAAADVTVNFGRSGIYSRFLNSTVVPFYNPGVQGLSRFVRMFTEKKGTKQLVLLSAKLVVLGFAVGGINDLINAIWEAANDEEDETYDQLTDYQKQNNILIPFGDGRYIKIPKGRSLNVFGIGAQNVIDMAQGEDVNWIGSIKTAVGQISPNDPFTDNLVAPLIAAGNNRTWYGSSIESTADEQVEPSQRYDETTDYFSRWLGGVLNYSPKKIHYVLDAYTGVVGDYILPIFTPKGGGDVLENVAMTAGDNFLVDGTTSNRISSDYYSRIDELIYEKNDTSGTDTASATVALRFMNSQRKAIRGFYAEIQKVNSGDLSPNEKAEKSRELKTTLNGIMLNAMASEQEVYETAKNIKSKYAYKKDGTYYNEIGEELTEEAYIDIIYREVNREVFGAEYALQLYNPDTYVNATEAVENCATYDLYYDAYFDLKSIDGDVDFTKGEVRPGSTRANQWEYIRSMDATKDQRVALAKSFFDIDNDDIVKANMSGIYTYDYINFICDTGVFYSDNDKTRKEKVLEYVNEMDLSSVQKDTLYRLAGYSDKTIDDAPWN